MKNRWLRYLIDAVVAVVIAFGVLKFIIIPYQEHKREVSQEAHYALTNSKYALFQAFNEYRDVLFALTELNQKIQKAPDSQKSALGQEISALEKQLAQSSTNLNIALTSIKKYYSDALMQERIQAFQDWKNKSEKQISHSTNDSWEVQFLGLQLGINRAISKAETGYEDKNQQIMALVPAAEEALKKHPNDKKLCAVMQQHLTDDPQLTAQQIAFFNVGDHYCPRYYANPTAWSGWMVAPTPSSQERPTYHTEKATRNNSSAEKVVLNQKYGTLTYSQYYNQYVLPRIPKALETLQDHKKNGNLCLTAAFSSGPRNPEHDAARAAYVQAGKQYCPSNTIQKGYYGTGVFCFTYCEMLCPTGMTCDCIERCKQTPGVLFKDNL